MPRRTVLRSDPASRDVRERLQQLRAHNLLTEEEYQAAIAVSSSFGEQPEGVYRCSFCAKDQREVRHLFVGPGRVYICNECIGLFQSMLNEDDTYVHVDQLEVASCDLCGQDVDLLDDHAGFLCPTCLGVIEARRSEIEHSRPV